MKTDWRERLRNKMIERGLNPKQLSLMAGRGETFVRDILDKGKDPSVGHLTSVTKVLGMSIAELMEGEGGYIPRIPVIGTVADDETWTADEDGCREIEFRMDDGESVALEIRGNDMAPVYRDGDVVIGAKSAGNSVDNFIGLDCIILAEDGNRYLKFLNRGTVRGRYNLRSHDPSARDVENVRVSWVAPIKWIKRGIS